MAIYLSLGRAIPLPFLLGFAALVGLVLLFVRQLRSDLFRLALGLTPAFLIPACVRLAWPLSSEMFGLAFVLLLSILLMALSQVESDADQSSALLRYGIGYGAVFLIAFAGFSRHQRRVGVAPSILEFQADRQRTRIEGSSIQRVIRPDEILFMSGSQTVRLWPDEVFLTPNGLKDARSATSEIAEIAGAVR